MPFLSKKDKHSLKCIIWSNEHSTNLMGIAVTRKVYWMHRLCFKPKRATYIYSTVGPRSSYESNSFDSDTVKGMTINPLNSSVQRHLTPEKHLLSTHRHGVRCVCCGKSLSFSGEAGSDTSAETRRWAHIRSQWIKHKPRSSFWRLCIKSSEFCKTTSHKHTFSDKRHEMRRSWSQHTSRSPITAGQRFHFIGEQKKSKGGF